MKLNIRQTTEKDFENIRNILIETWLDAYSFIPEKDLRFYLDATYNDENLLRICNDSENQSLIAEIDEKAAGWMRLNNNQTDKRFYISSLYVLPTFQGYGIGKRLLNIAYEEAAKNQYEAVWLGVMTENVKSVEWYKKNGFHFIEEEPFKIGETVVNHLIGFKKILNE